MNVHAVSFTSLLVACSPSLHGRCLPSPFIITINHQSARIAQRFALIKIHKLWNSGRAEPISGVIADTDAKGEKATPATPATDQPEAAARATARAPGSTAQDTCAGRSVRVLGEREGERGREGEEVARYQWAPSPAHQASLESTVAAVAGLPQEVLRRIVSYCTL